MLRRDAKVDLLRGVPLFSDLSKTELAKIAAIAEEWEVAQGETLMWEGLLASDFVILVEGSLLVTRKGRRVNQLGPGDFLGEIALLTGGRRSATVSAEVHVRALRVRERDFHQLLKTTPSVTVKVLKALAQRLPSHDDFGTPLSD